MVPFKLILQLFLFTFLTVIGSLVVILTYFLKYLQSLTLIPYVTIHVLCTELPYAARFFFIIFIPILVFSYFCMFTTLYAVYPLFRRYYHHGLYDGLEKILLKETICYLSMVKAIFSLWLFIFCILWWFYEQNTIKFSLQIPWKHEFYFFTLIQQFLIFTSNSI